MRSQPEPLADLLRTLFTTDELRLHLAGEPDGIALVDGLPGTIASHATYAHEAALGLARRGLVTDEFFERLVTVRANRRDDIHRARDAWLAVIRPAPDLVLGGRYCLKQKLGEGGVASVWCAVDEQIGQIVAVKLLHPRHETDARVRRRFARGAATLTGLQHPSIVRVVAAVEEDNRRCFYIMEYIHGVSLDVCVRERRYATDVLLALAMQVGDALAHIHQRGLLHRDVKPANILVVNAEVVRLIDFDLVTGEDFVAQTTQAFGTGIYMPPEAHTADRKTAAYDVFSLARTIEFIVRGREPTASELFDVTGLPGTAAVRAILRAALQLDPRCRICDMATFCAALRTALAEQRTPPPGPAVALAAAPYRAAAIASIAAHVLALVSAQPPAGALPLLLFVTAPSVRIVLDREDFRPLNYLHWLWLAPWVVMVFFMVAALFDKHTRSSLEPFPAILLPVALALGVYASVAYLLRPRPAR